MKLMIAALALVSLVACNSQKKSVSDDSGANMPTSSCHEGGKAGCDSSAKASCDTAAKGSCEAGKSACATKPQG